MPVFFCLSRMSWPESCNQAPVIELHRTGRIDGNDDVAVSYCPLTMQAHTIPLVNL